MRVNDERRTPASIIDKRGKDKNIGRSSIETKGFPNIFEQYQKEDLQKELDELLEKIDVIGQRLVKNFSIYDLKEYKGLLTRFISEVNSRSYKLVVETSWTRQGRPKVYQRVEEINNELEELTQLFMAKQKDQIKILKKLDNIRGILVDIYT